MNRLRKFISTTSYLIYTSERQKKSFSATQEASNITEKTASYHVVDVWDFCTVLYSAEFIQSSHLQMSLLKNLFKKNVQLEIQNLRKEQLVPFLCILNPLLFIFQKKNP